MLRITAIATMLAALVGCGGGQKSANEPTGGGGGGDTWDPADREARSGTSEMVSGEALEETQHAFDRKRPQIVDCYEKAVESGSMKKKVAGSVTVQMRITTAGRAQNVTVTSDKEELKSEVLTQCIVDKISSWDLPKPNVAFDFSFGYQFQEGI